MRVYYDTGVLLPLYIEEVFSKAVTKIVEERAEPIPINLFHEVEFENAVRLKVFRRELTASKLNEILAARDEDIRGGRLIRRPVNWPLVYEEARRLSEASTVKTGCRTLDVLHIAIAVKWGCEWFATADERQLKAARMAGLKLLELHPLPQGERE
jgi:predicted nucleic acid-binding protein